MKTLTIILGANSNFLNYLNYESLNESDVCYFIYNNNFSSIKEKYLGLNFKKCKNRFFKNTSNWISILKEDLEVHEIEYLQILNLIRFPMKRRNFSKLHTSDWINSFKAEPVELINVIQKLLNNKIIGNKKLSGSIVSFSSYLGLYGSQDQIPYALSKASLVHFNKSISPILINYSFRINSISFGQIKFLIHKKMVSMKSIFNSEISVMEVVSTMKFLFSKESSAINGQNINLSR